MKIVNCVAALVAALLVAQPSAAGAQSYRYSFTWTYFEPRQPTEVFTLSGQIGTVEYFGGYNRSFDAVSAVGTLTSDLGRSINVTSVTGGFFYVDYLPDAPNAGNMTFQLASGDSVNVWVERPTAFANYITPTLRYAAMTSSYDLSPVNAVPEPATWALMMFGFGGIGFALRRRSKVATRIRFA